MERERGFEPATPTLARSCSTTELFPPASRTVAQLRNPNHLGMMPDLCFWLSSGRLGWCPDTLRAHDSLCVPVCWHTEPDPGRERHGAGRGSFRGQKRHQLAPCILPHVGPSRPSPARCRGYGPDAEAARETRSSRSPGARAIHPAQCHSDGEAESGWAVALMSLVK